MLRMDGANSQPSSRPSSVYSASSRSTTSIRNGKVRDLRYRMTDMESQVDSGRLVCKKLQTQQGLQSARLTSVERRIQRLRNMCSVISRS